MGNGATECGWHHALEACGGFGGFWKSQLVELSPASEEDGWLSLARGGLGQVSHEVGGRWKSQNRKNVYLTPYVKEPLNSKVIKGFVPELRNRYMFFVFRDSYVLCIYVTNIMNILCTFHISVSGYVIYIYIHTHIYIYNIYLFTFWVIYMYICKYIYLYT